MQGVIFRTATPEDGAAMLAIHLAAIQAIEDRFYDRATRESWAFGLTQEGYGRSMAEGENFELAQEASGKIVAFCGVKNGEVFGLYVHPESQGRGIGAALLKRGELRLRTASEASLPLTASLNAQAFYEAQGYRMIEHVDVKSRGGLMQRVARMSKTLEIMKPAGGCEG